MHNEAFWAMCVSVCVYVRVCALWICVRVRVCFGGRGVKEREGEGLGQGAGVLWVECGGHGSRRLVRGVAV